MNTVVSRSRAANFEPGLCLGNELHLDCSRLRFGIIALTMPSGVEAMCLKPISAALDHYSSPEPGPKHQSPAEFVPVQGSGFRAESSWSSVCTQKTPVFSILPTLWCCLLKQCGLETVLTSNFRSTDEMSTIATTKQHLSTGCTSFACKGATQCVSDAAETAGNEVSASRGHELYILWIS